jgi:hypothetical protein
MVQNNKVLTVSYGTFSCTLEGFDDAFDTMKAIAEYFRDLAADDRYFGAEPPQPDADMLARIAEGKIARQVQARRDGDGFVLRAGSAGAAPAIAAQSPPPAPESPAAPQTGPIRSPAAQPAAAAKPEVAAAPATMAGTDHITEDTVKDLIAEDAPDELVPATDSIAAKLQRIRAVVSRNQDAAEPEDYSEDEHAEAVTRPTVADADDEDIDLDAMLGRIEAGTPPPDAAPSGEDSLFGHLDEEDDDDEIPDADPDLVNFLDDDGDDDIDDEEDDDEIALDDGLHDDDDDDEPVGRDAPPAQAQAPERARLVKIKRSRIAAAIAAGELEEVPEDVPAPAAEPAPKPAPQAAQQPASALSPEAEADLMRELAEVEAEFIGPGGDAGSGPDDAADPQPARQPASRRDRPRTRMTDLGEDDGEDVNRIMDATDRKLVDPEAAARHEAYSRMRAAVAATRAERSAGGTLGTHSSDKTYREDLASVVRPRRPEPGPSRPARPTTEPRSAPLRLVAEQRVDDQTGPAASGPVRPRRVTTQLLDEPAETGTPTPEGGFSEFAMEVGAKELPELLEAAAAYMSFVEGRAQFSRPQLMNKVRQVGGDDINREDSLRSFGQLLREGKIEKKGGGRFAASGRIGFRPDDDERVAG